jgi:hypothetical protein
MRRQLFFAITLIGTAALLGTILFNTIFLSTKAVAATALQCEDKASNCLGRCADRTGGAGDRDGHQSKCLVSCDRQLNRCNIRTR